MFLVAIIVFATVFVIFFILIYLQERRQGNEIFWWGMLVFSLIMSALISAFISAFAIPISIGIVDTSFKSTKGCNLVPLTTEKIVAMKDGKGEVNGQVGGRFFLGIGGVHGSVEGGEEYYYYYKESGEGIQMDKVKADVATIIENNSEQPRVEKSRYEPYENKPHLTTAPICPTDDPPVKIYVPEGSIATEFNLDLE